MSKSQRTKGARGELEALRLLGEELGITLERNLQQTRNGGGDCLMVKGWAIEVKRHERLSRPTWWAQAVRQAREAGVEPMLLYRRNRGPWHAWIHTRDGQYREGGIVEAAGAIREKWARWP